ncbi:MAG: methyltransferase [Candidatus Bathyarchaeota archaeon]
MAAILWVTIFQPVQFITMGIFVVFISDFRKKTGMVPLVNEKITKLLKFSYFGPLIICAYTLATMDYLSYFDFLAVALTVFGTIVVVKSKLDLGICHTWAGYCKKSSELEVSGIYAYIRHPLYTGIHLFSVGELVTLTLHAQWYLTVVAVIMGGFMVSFLTITASKETAYLTKKLGEHFLRYKEKVHPFLPIKKYS